MGFKDARLLRIKSLVDSATFSYFYTNSQYRTNNGENVKYGWIHFLFQTNLTKTKQNVKFDKKLTYSYLKASTGSNLAAL